MKSRRVDAREEFVESARVHLFDVMLLFERVMFAGQAGEPREA